MRRTMSRRVGGAIVAVTMVLAMGRGTAAGRTPAPAGPSPGWMSGLHWVNSAPLQPADLAGRVVLVEFWTFDCYNCRRTVPAMKALASRYRGDSSVVIVGVHTPEMEREHDVRRVRNAVRELGLDFPVAQDNAFTAWRAFGNQYWPSLYVLDGRGMVKLNHIGELHVGTPEWGRVTATVDALRHTKARAS